MTTIRHLRSSRAELIAQAIEQDIRQDALPPGTRIGTRAELRERFAAAPATVSEALRVLETRGLTTTRPGPGGGIFVAAVSRQVRLRDALLDFDTGAAQYADCLIVRNALEPLVCREAARTCTADDAVELRAIVSRMATRRDDPKGFLLLGWELHRRLANMCQNLALRGLYLTLLEFVESGLNDVQPLESHGFARDLAIHAELAEAVISGDADQLERAVRQHAPSVDELEVPSPVDAEAPPRASSAGG